MPVSPNMKISDLLKTYPTLLDVLIQQSPNFARLRNPVFRRVLPKLVTVAQAATMGGLEPATLVRNLNRALGEADVEVGLVEVNTMADTPAPPWYNTAPITTTLDVREAQRRKEEPFAAIMAAVASVKLGEIFLLRNSFEPLPLYDVLLSAHEAVLRHKERLEGSEELATGLELIFKEFTKLFEAEGVAVISSLGKPYDFNLHEVLGQVETAEAPEGTVVDEVARGYTLEGKVLRPARVRIARPLPRGEG